MIVIFKLRSVVAVVAVAMGSTALADIINVGPGNSIQTAIDAAVDGDEIIVAPGTYFETINFLGKAITLQSSDGPEVTIIDAQLMGIVVTCNSGEGKDTVLDGFTITGGQAESGGGMRNDHSSPTVTDCTFTGNTANFIGGGMFNGTSNPTVTDCAFSLNTTATGSGGGMFNANSSPMVTNCTFSGNSAVGQSSHGGGMLNTFESSPTLTNCTFSGNTADGNGGGMHTFESSPTLTNCTFSGNTADGNGGGMSNFFSNPTVTNCTFEGNTASTGGGLYNDGSSPTVTNCILWDNFPNQFNSVAGPTVSYCDVQGGFPGIGNIHTSPLFVDPANGDYRLSAGSPCIDAADNTAVPLDISTDLDGNPRFVDDPATDDTGNGDPPIVDMGAYEFQGLPCPWDLNGDGEVNVLDLIELVMSFGPCEGCSADFDDDGIVNVLDLIALIMNFGPCHGTACVWDVNGDGVVDQSDVVAVTSNLGPCEDPNTPGACPWDVNGDGVVNGQDVAAVATHFGPCP